MGIWILIMKPVEYLFYNPQIDGWSRAGWYFWDEIWCSVYGPYESAKKADEECKRYAKEILGN